MKKDNTFFDDISKFASSAFASVATARRELSSYIRECVESFVRGMNFVTKDELEIVKKIALQNDKEIQNLKKILKVEGKPQKKKKTTTTTKSQKVSVKAKNKNSM